MLHGASGPCLATAIFMVKSRDATGVVAASPPSGASSSAAVAMGRSGVVWARFCIFWGGLGWSGLVSACCKVVWGGLRARAGLGSFQHVVGSSGVDWNGWELSGVVRVRFCGGLE